MAEQETRGEDALIQATFAPLASGFSGALGLKDDCAVLSPPPGMDLVLTTDAVAEGVHFLADDPAADIAWKAVAVNVSDLVAKGARPVVYLLALSLPERPERRWLEAFQAGLAEAQAAFGISLAGGDTDRRPGPLSANVTAIGVVDQGRFVHRTTARAGDHLFLSGTLGCSALGLLLRRDFDRTQAMGLDEGSAKALVARYRRPQPRIALAPLLAAFASAAMDISDGLIKDCGRLARASGVAARIEGGLIPFSDAARTALRHLPDLFGVALTGGDDYEVLAAVPPANADAFRDAAAKGGVAVAEIGRLAEGQGVTVTGPDGDPFDVESAGWDHFP